VDSSAKGKISIFSRLGKRYDSEDIFAFRRYRKVFAAYCVCGAFIIVLMVLILIHMIWGLSAELGVSVSGILCVRHNSNDNRYPLTNMRTTSKSLIPVILATLLCFFDARVVFAQQPSPDQIIYDANTWSDLYTAYLRLGKNADGVVAGAFTDKVSSLLADRWDLVNELRMLSSKDKGFMNFVLKNINEAVPADRARKIMENSTKECFPKENKQLCQRIVQSLDGVSKRR